MIFGKLDKIEFIFKRNSEKPIKKKTNTWRIDPTGKN